MKTATMPRRPCATTSCASGRCSTRARLAFPCDSPKAMWISTRSASARGNYLYARAVVGREYATPAVQRCH